MPSIISPLHGSYSGLLASYGADHAPRCRANRSFDAVLYCCLLAVFPPLEKRAVEVNVFRTVGYVRTLHSKVFS